MIKKRKCQVCEKFFISRTKVNIFCSKACQAKRNNKQPDKFPEWLCPNCGFKSQLTFDPRINLNKWKEYKCPACHYALIKDLKEAIK